MRTVLHLSSSEYSDVEHAFANAENLLADVTVDLDDVAVVVNGDGIRMLTETAPTADRVATLIERGATVHACGNSLEARDIDRTEFVDGVEIASSAMAELTRKQANDYAYVKVP